MIRINKGPEPKEWTARIKTPGAKYERIPELADALLKEQGCLCAYCMRGIPVRDTVSNEPARIEHIQSQTKYPDRAMDFDNMVICCPGSINGSDHCEKSKHDADITLSPFDVNVQNSISYSTRDGRIKSSNEIWNSELDIILCLNNSLLMYNRAEALEGVTQVLLEKKYSNAVLQSKLDDWTTINSDGKLKPYSGVVIWYLKKKLARKN